MNYSLNLLLSLPSSDCKSIPDLVFTNVGLLAEFEPEDKVFHSKVSLPQTV